MKSQQSKVTGSALYSLAPGLSLQLRPTGVLLSFTLAITGYEASDASMTCQEVYLAAQPAASKCSSSVVHDDDVIGTCSTLQMLLFYATDTWVHSKPTYVRAMAVECQIPPALSRQTCMTELHVGMSSCNMQ